MTWSSTMRTRIFCAVVMGEAVCKKIRLHRSRSFAAGFAEMPSFPTAIGRLNDVNVIFNKDLFNETELGIPLKFLHESHRRLSKFRQDPVRGVRHNGFS